MKHLSCWRCLPHLCMFVLNFTEYIVMPLVISWAMCDAMLCDLKVIVPNFKIHLSSLVIRWTLKSSQHLSLCFVGSYCVSCGIDRTNNRPAMTRYHRMICVYSSGHFNFTRINEGTLFVFVIWHRFWLIIMSSFCEHATLPLFDICFVVLCVINSGTTVVLSSIFVYCLLDIDYWYQLKRVDYSQVTLLPAIDINQYFT